MSTIPEVKLNDGTAMPQLGFGLYKVTPEDVGSSCDVRPGNRLAFGGYCGVLR
jgi:hypothetical protein